MVSDYLRRPQLQALPASQRTLMVLVMRKLWHHPPLRSAARWIP